MTRRRPKRLTKVAPRIAPPWPARSFVGDWLDAAAELGMEPFAWQELAATYAMAADEDGRWLYPELALVVGRQNGKTEFLLPLIVDALDNGLRVLHTAQNRITPRHAYMRVMSYYTRERPDEVIEARRANGQEQLVIRNGGEYRIIAPLGGARGHSVDLVILDEAREYRDFDFVGAILPTLAASPNPRTVYVSSAGDADSVVLNDLRRRSGTDPALAYLEWSAGPDRRPDDMAGWREANPAPIVTDEYLERQLRSRPPAIFETEHLCRWAVSTAPTLVPAASWDRLAAELERPARPVLGIAHEPDGRRAAAVLAWQQSDGTLGVSVLADVYGESGPIDLDAFGAELAGEARRLKVTAVGFDPATDADLARHLLRTRPIAPREFAQASERFVRAIEGDRIRHAESTPIALDLPYAARKGSSSGIWYAVRGTEERAITAVLAAIRAVWLAATPRTGRPRVH